ncbi:MAG: molybdenum cofactor guanylyltransferase [Firmicutes bacterium]|nr:molybdenum cofactor guanylyltransferase [Bacillota bacterium]
MNKRIERTPQEVLLKNWDAVIAAGGASSRMDGFPKGLLQLGGKTFCEHLIEALRPFDRIAISANLPEYEAFGLPVYADRQEGRGPLSAILSALEHTEKDWVFVCPCDMPLLTEEALFAMLQPEMFRKDAVIYRAQGRVIPILGFYHKRVLPIAEEQLQKQDLKLLHLLQRLDAQVIEPGCPERFVNINDRAAYEELLRQTWVNTQNADLI